MEISLAVLADYASVTREGKLNIMGLFQEINPPNLPFTMPQMFLVAVLEASPAEAGLERPVDIILLDADGNQKLKINYPWTVPQPKREGSSSISNLVLSLAGVRFTTVGPYQISLLVGDDEKKAIRLVVNEPFALDNEG